jgi:hypothetical protein
MDLRLFSCKLLLQETIICFSRWLRPCRRTVCHSPLHFWLALPPQGPEQAILISQILGNPGHLSIFTLLTSTDLPPAMCRSMAGKVLATLVVMLMLLMS